MQLLDDNVPKGKGGLAVRTDLAGCVLDVSQEEKTESSGSAIIETQSNSLSSGNSSGGSGGGSEKKGKGTMGKKFGSFFTKTAQHNEGGGEPFHQKLGKKLEELKKEDGGGGGAGRGELGNSSPLLGGGTGESDGTHSSPASSNASPRVTKQTKHKRGFSKGKNLSQTIG